jgi:WD40 repeat protein
VLADRNHGGSLPFANRPVQTISAAPDGKHFVTTCGGKVLFWQIPSGKSTREVEHPGVFDAKVSNDGRQMVTASTDGTVLVWNVSNGERAADPLRHPDWVLSASFSANQQYVLTACRDRMARVWDWRTGQIAFPPMEHDDAVFDAKFTPDGNWVLSVGRDGKLRIWDWRLGQPVCPPKPLSGWAGRMVLVTPDGCRALVAGCMSATDIFDLRRLQDDTRLDCDALCALGELLSGRRIHGGGTVNLTSAEWLDRWHEFRAKHLRYHKLDWPGYPAPAPTRATPLTPTEPLPE